MVVDAGWVVVVDPGIVVVVEPGAPVVVVDLAFEATRWRDSRAMAMASSRRGSPMGRPPAYGNGPIDGFSPLKIPHELA